jgi:hypothetical protein
MLGQAAIKQPLYRVHPPALFKDLRPPSRYRLSSVVSRIV